MSTFADNLAKQIVAQSTGKTLKPVPGKYALDADGRANGGFVQVVEGDRVEGLPRWEASGYAPPIADNGLVQYGWGYGGSGPHQLAEAIMSYIGVPDALIHGFSGKLNETTAISALQDGPWSIDLERVGLQVAATLKVADRELAGQGVDMEKALTPVYRTYKDLLPPEVHDVRDAVKNALPTFDAALTVGQPKTSEWSVGL